MAIDHELAAVICIEDPLREEAAAVVRKLKETGISKVVMMTGDSDRTAKAIQQELVLMNIIQRFFPKTRRPLLKRRRRLVVRLL